MLFFLQALAQFIAYEKYLTGPIIKPVFRKFN